MHSTAQNYGSYTDDRDGTTYKTVQIGEKIWMAENLNYDSGNDSYCYNDSVDNCTKYGRLYTWEVATSVCPAEWHLPSKEEFETLVAFYQLKQINPYKALVNDGISGFNAISVGIRNKDGKYGLKGFDTKWWTSTELSGNQAWIMYLSNFHTEIFITKTNCDKSAYSIRCLKD